MLTERVPAGPSAGKEAEKVRTRLLRQVDERRSPRTRATLNQLLDRHLDVVDLEQSTRRTYQGYIERHIRPVLGPLPLGRVDGEVLDSFYAQRRVDHRTTREHECDERCRATPVHAAVGVDGASDPLDPVRCLRARRPRKWLAVSPTDAAEPPPQPKPKPSRPSPAEAARIIVEVWKDPAWGTLVWLAMVTVRGEASCAGCADGTTTETPDPARPSAGRHPPRPSTSSYSPSRQPVLRRPLEPGLCTAVWTTSAAAAAMPTPRGRMEDVGGHRGVTAGLAWPRIIVTVSTGTPAASSSEAVSWRISCSLILGSLRQPGGRRRPPRFQC
jgi:hypothetical protein